MKQMLIDWISRPENWLLVILTIIQLYKLLRPSLPKGITDSVDKASSFLEWSIPALYNVVEALEKSGTIDKTSKFSVFFDKLMEEAKKQNIVLSVEDVAKAKTIVSGIAQATKLPAPAQPSANPPSPLPATK